jgi:hypothetical protein
MEFGQTELDELLNYIKFLEAEVEKYKSAALVYYTQRNNAEIKLSGKKMEVKETTIDIEVEQI